MVAAGCVDTGFFEDSADDVGAVGGMLGEGLAGPVAGDQDAAAAEAEVLAVVGLRFALAGDQFGAGVFGLHAVAEPVRAPRRARQHLDVSVEPFEVRALPVGQIVGVAVGPETFLVTYLVRYATALPTLASSGARMPW